MSLSATGLTVGKNRTIEPLHHTHDNWLDCRLIDKALSYIGVENLIEIKLVWTRVSCWIGTGDTYARSIDEFNEILSPPSITSLDIS